MILEGGIHINKTTFTQQLANELAAIILKASRKEKVLALLLNLSMSIGCVCLAAAILAKKASPILLILVIPMVIACMKHIYTILEVSEAKISELLYNKFGNKSTSYWITDDNILWCQPDGTAPKGTTLDKIKQIFETDNSFFIFVNGHEPTFYAIDKAGFSDLESRSLFERLLSR